MRVLVSSCCSLWLSRKAVERARELDAAWASADHMPLMGDPEHRSARSSYRVGDAEYWDNAYSLPAMVPRHDFVLLQVFDELGWEKMAGTPTTGDPDEIHCLTIPDDLIYYVGSYTGEWIAEEHREWSPHGNEGAPAGGAYSFRLESVFVSDWA